MPYEAYRLIFSEYNLGFSLPRTDTCATCDEFEHKIAHAKTEEETEKLKASKHAHLLLVKRFVELKRKYVAKGKEGIAISTEL